MYLFLERGGGREEREKDQCMVASCTPPAGDLAHNPDMCPDWESNLRTLWFAGQHSIHRATPATNFFFFFKKEMLQHQAKESILDGELRDLVFYSITITSTPSQC